MVAIDNWYVSVYERSLMKKRLCNLRQTLDGMMMFTGRIVISTALFHLSHVTFSFHDILMYIEGFNKKYMPNIPHKLSHLCCPDKGKKASLIRLYIVPVSIPMLCNTGII